MLKSIIVALCSIAVTTVSANNCRMTISTYSDSTCSTSKEVLPMYVNGQVTLNMPFNKCIDIDGVNGPPYMKMVLCDPQHFIAMARYSDSNCQNHEQVPVRGYQPDYCQIEDASTWVKVTAVTLTGNKYGIGWAEGWSIFLCQTVLFGVCSGM